MIKIEIGDKVKDKLSPFKGIVIAEIKYYNGCHRYQVQAKKLEAGKIIDEWIDDGQITLVKKAIKVKAIEATEIPEENPGGPGDVPTFNIP